MKKLRELTEYEYDNIRRTGLLYELFPEATGNYVDDCRKSANGEDDEDDSETMDKGLFDLADVFYAVQNINEDITSSLQNDDGETECLTLVTDGFSCIVKFGGEKIWSTLEDTHVFEEEENKYEELEPFLRNAVHEVLIKRQCQYEAIADVIYDTL